VANGAFREDLFYRLAVVVLQLPALRERVGDVTFLANAFLRKFGQENGRKALKFGAQAGRAIATHDWPGNVRELENRIRRATIMANSRQISVDDLELRTVDHLPLRLKEAREELEREMVALALQRNGGKISGAAQDLGISRPTLYELMDKLGVKR
jgi:two-component system NtrC family response regulator